MFLILPLTGLLLLAYLAYLRRLNESRHAQEDQELTNAIRIIQRLKDFGRPTG